MTSNQNIPQLVFAKAEVSRSLPANVTAPKVEFIIDSTQLSPQSYRIERGADARIRVIGGDANGAIYGGLDIAEAAQLGNLDALETRVHSPFAEAYDRQYQPQHLTRIGIVDILSLTNCVVKDVEIARGFTNETKKRTT